MDTHIKHGISADMVVKQYLAHNIRLHRIPQSHFLKGRTLRGKNTLKNMLLKKYTSFFSPSSI